METFQQFCLRHPPSKDYSILFRFENTTLTDVFPDLEWLPYEIVVLNNKVELFVEEFNEIGTYERLEEAEKDCQAILDWSWERLNVGVWSNVDVKYRLLLAYHRLLEAVLRCIRCRVVNNKDVSILDAMISILEPLDLALIMSPDLKLKSCCLTQVADRFHEDCITKYLPECNEKPNYLDFKTKFFKLKRTISDETRNIPVPSMTRNSITRIHHSSLDIFRFQNEFLCKDVPVLITGASENWPCFNQHPWRFSALLDKIAFRTVPIEVGSSYTDTNWTQKLMKFVDFAEEYISGSCDVMGYLAQYGLFQQIPELAQDFAIPDYCASTRDSPQQNTQDELNDDDDDDCSSTAADVDINAWIGPAGTVSPLHTDPRDNLFVQIEGTKYIRLISSKVPIEQLYPLDGLQSNTSQVNIEHPDRALHPGFFDIDPSLMSEAVICPGEMLFIPRGCWHFVKSLSPSISLSFWFN